MPAHARLALELAPAPRAICPHLPCSRLRSGSRAPATRRATARSMATARRSAPSTTYSTSARPSRSACAYHPACDPPRAISCPYPHAGDEHTISYSHAHVHATAASLRYASRVLAVSSFWGNPPQAGYHPMTILGPPDCATYGECPQQQPWVRALCGRGRRGR